MDGFWDAATTSFDMSSVPTGYMYAPGVDGTEGLSTNVAVQRLTTVRTGAVRLLVMSIGIPLQNGTTLPSTEGPLMAGTDLEHLLGE